MACAIFYTHQTRGACAGRCACNHAHQMEKTVFVKSMKAKRCTDVMFKLRFYCLSVTVEDLNL